MLEGKSSSRVIGIRVSQDVVDELDKLATEYGENRTAVVRTLLEQGSSVYSMARKKAIKERNDRDAQVERVVQQMESKFSKDELALVMPKMTFEFVRAVMQTLMEDVTRMQDTSE